MDKAPLRRGMETIHIKYGENTALLAGDVMLVKAYEYLNKIDSSYLHQILFLFNQSSNIHQIQWMTLLFDKINLFFNLKK